MRMRFEVGDLVKHKEGDDRIFVNEACLIPVDENHECLYQCSMVWPVKSMIYPDFSCGGLLLRFGAVFNCSDGSSR